MRLLLDLIPRYYRHARANPDTLLVHFYGVHRISPALGRRVGREGRRQAAGALGEAWHGGTVGRGRLQRHTPAEVSAPAWKGAWLQTEYLLVMPCFIPNPQPHPTLVPPALPRCASW